jgi:chitin disaccharide deacetylase
MTAPARELRLCADDFGLAVPISRGILRLAARGRLSDVSCIVNAPDWPGRAHELAAAPVRLGLHLNLTEGRPLSATLAAVWPTLPSLPRLIVLAHLRRLPLAALRDELDAQLAAFIAGCGRAPAHLDGHQHVHHLPGVRELLPVDPALPVRHTGCVRGPGFATKRLLIEATGGRALGRRLQAQGNARNTQLFGVYDFVQTDYRGLFRRWLTALPQRGALIFCHPGEPGSGDAIAAARARELAYLDSDAFDADLAAAGVRLAV